MVSRVEHLDRQRRTGAGHRSAGALKPGDTGKTVARLVAGRLLRRAGIQRPRRPRRSEGREPLNVQQRRRYLGLFVEARTQGGRRFGGSPFEDFTRQDIELYLDKVKAVGRRPGDKGRRGGKSVRDAHLAAIRKLFEFAIDRGLTKFRNPTKGIKRRYKGKGNTPWNDDDFAKFRNHWDGFNVPRLAFEIALAFGFRRSDLHLLGDHLVGADGVLRTGMVKGSRSDALPDYPDNPIEIDLNDYPECARASGNSQGASRGNRRG